MRPSPAFPPTLANVPLTVAAVIAVVVAVIAAGCSGDTSDSDASAEVVPPSDAAPTDAAPTTVEPAFPDTADASAAAAAIRADGCGPRLSFGAGSFVDPRHVVTAAHVVAGADTIEVVLAGGQRDEGEVVLFDPDLDVALIRTASVRGDPVALRDTTAMEDEDGVVAFVLDGPTPGGGDGQVELVGVDVVRPATVRTTDIYRDRDVTRPGFEIEGLIDVGDSGGVVVLPGGAVGVVWARSTEQEGHAWAVDLPPAVHDAAAGAPPEAAVDTGPCVE